MLRNLILLFSIVSFVLGGANFSHAAELHGHGSSGAEQSAEAGDVHRHHHHHHHHHDDGGSNTGDLGGSSVHCGAPILGTELVIFSFGEMPRDVHEQVPAEEFVGQSYALDPPPPRLLAS